ncbi:hypothetical protein Q9233_012290 [Columba guinea]|nr:hypothetical protein Q9233_012290 [Columba guinea]
MDVPRLSSKDPHSSPYALSHTESVFNQQVKMRKSGILSKQYMCRVELETVTVTVSIQDFVADVVSELVFRNMSQVSKETMFIFPLDFNTVVHTFYATMGDTRIEAMVLEKEEAQQLCKATSGVENLTYLQDQGDLWGPVFACFLGTLPPNREVTISLCYVQELTLQPDGAAQFCWPRELFPSRKYINWISLEEETSKSLHFGICLRSGHGVSHIAVNSSHTPLQYIAPDQTSAEVSLKLPPWMQDDLNLLVYYRGSPSLSAVVERRDPKAPPGSLLGDTVVMVTLMPNIPDTVPNPGQSGEFLFLMDRSLFHDAQLFIFIQRKVSNEEEAVMAEVYRYRDHHRCFCFPTNSCDSFNLSQAMALETKGECVCIHSRMDMTSEAVKCLQQALQPLASGISLHWDLPPGLEVSMIRKAPEMIFQGHQSSIYAQIHGQAQDPEVDEGAVTLQYYVGHQSFDYTLRFSLSPSSDGRLPVHRMAMMHLLWKLAWEGTSRAEKDIRHSTVKSSLSLGVLSPFTSVVAVRMKQRDAWHHDSLPPGSSMSSLSCNLVPCQLLWLRGFRPGWFKSTKFWMVQKCQSCLETLDRKARDTEALTQFSASCKGLLVFIVLGLGEVKDKENSYTSTLRWRLRIKCINTCPKVVVALQKANGSWAPTAALASALGLSKADVEGQRPSEVVQPTAWATVLALVWLHQYKWKVSWSDLLQAKACRWLQDQEGRIIGGQEARPHSRRYMAYVSIGSQSGTSNCGGFLIHPYAVLSAAHCVAGKTGVNITVTLGAHNIKKEELSQQKFHIGHWVIHPNYSGDTLANDIMLLKLKPKAKLTKQVNRVPLPRHNEHIKQGTRCKVAGWGWTSTTRDKTSVLMEVDLKVQSEDICEKSFKKNYLRESMICCGDEDGRKSTSRVRVVLGSKFGMRLGIASQGDSGGPLVCNGKAHGIVSYGHKNRIFPKVFTRVSYFEPWIRPNQVLNAITDVSAVVDVTIQDYVADVASELIYQNRSLISTEVLFVFPLGPQMAIYSFQTHSKDAKIQAVLRDKPQQLHEATGGWENMEYLQDQSEYPGEVFACFLGTLSPGKEVVVTLRYVQELSREPDGAAHFVLPPTLHPYTTLYAWNCNTGKLPYSLLLTASLQSPRGVARIHANFNLSPLIYTAQDHSTAQDSLFFLLKSLPLGCYFNIYCYGQTSEGIYPQSVEYTQDNVMEAMQRIPSTGSSLGDTNLLGTLRSIYDTPRPHGHTRQLFLFMAGLPPDKEAIAAEVCRHHNSHRCFSFFFSEDSAALAMALARETGGEAAYISSYNSMTAVVLKCLKRALKPAAEGISLSWTLPHGLEVEMLGGTPQSIFQGQHSLLYVQIHGQAQGTTVAKGVMTLQYSLDGQDVTHTIEFSLCPQGDGRLAAHRLAARRLLKRLSLEAVSESGDEPRHRAVQISLASGIICPFTSYVGVRTSQRVTWYPACKPPPPSVSSLKYVDPTTLVLCSPTFGPWLTKAIAECKELVSLQNVDGSWALSSGLASVLELDEVEIKGKMPGKDMEPSIWATVLAVTWLNRKGKCYQDLCELLEAKAVTWLCSQAVSQLDKCLEAANTLLGSSVKPSVFRL